ncbi:glutamine--tRNA ligase/YqeY domain fusion protein [Ferroacidibacillus organovorans]|uniref:glutamine--tRNA ligase/YqeY domain fusion protein n=1 Tax=Ferroacidibacillus organovorans TaxID=1765683 RepID=UPI001FD42629|nr:glutamine--tRNA ligase/YqeY domain fusion protein [Ferroacidibacillus organovorans]
MTTNGAASNYIKKIIEEDLREGRVAEVVTRFPPEPNGYLHIGHAKSICLNFDLANEFGGRTHLRFDDTNPLKEDEEYARAIEEDVRWLGYAWDRLCYASDYYEEMFERAKLLIRKGLAYVCELSGEEIRATRGTLTEPGTPSPFRNRSAEENLDQFERMRCGEFADGAKVLRAKIDMASPNINLRDPILYRIAHAPHYRAKNAWCIYPMYDYAHPLEDAIEGVTHSICTLEFEDHRPLYDWVIRACEMPTVPHQYEFARLNMTNTVMSKRNLKALVEQGVVDGWDDPRMPTIAGLRRKGYTPGAIRTFAREVGVAKSNSMVDERMLEHFVREDLKLVAPRTMAVLRPLRVVILNYPEGQLEWLEAENNSENPELGVRQIPFGREIWIEQDDFMENPPPKYFRLTPGQEVRLKHAYFIRCEKVIYDAAGKVSEVHCTYDPETKSGSGFTGRKVKGTIHWVCAREARAATFQLFEPIYLTESENGGDDGERLLNPNSLTQWIGYIEAQMVKENAASTYQFFRHGYFHEDSMLSTWSHPVFNRVVSLKSSYEVL